MTNKWDKVDTLWGDVKEALDEAVKQDLTQMAKKAFCTLGWKNDKLMVEVGLIDDERDIHEIHYVDMFKSILALEKDMPFVSEQCGCSEQGLKELRKIAKFFNKLVSDGEKYIKNNPD